MGCNVHIRRNADGLVRVHHAEYDWCEFQWTDGNFGCDCNRALFFAEAGGEDEPDIECGETAYSIVRVVADDGTEIVTQEK